MSRERIDRELAKLLAGGQKAEYIEGPREAILYRDVPSAGASLGLPSSTDVIVPVPPGYPAAMIDLAGLPADSPLILRTKGGKNSQGTIVADGKTWQLVSYHPHNGGGGPPWDQNRHGFHTYFDHLLAWLHQLG
jgi:hypothetical protein